MLCGAAAVKGVRRRREGRSRASAPSTRSRGGLCRRVALSAVSPYTRCAAFSNELKRKENMTAAIVVCEDDPTHRELIRASLARGDYRIFEIEDGRHLVEAAKSTRPDLLILDLRMPESNGVEVLSDLRADPRTTDVPVLVLSGAVRRTDRDAA